MAIALRYAARSDLGLGPKAATRTPATPARTCSSLADGMGGHAAGDVASSMIVGELAPLDDEDVGADQASACSSRHCDAPTPSCDQAMRDNPDLAGMGTHDSSPCCAPATSSRMAHIGDSRAYLLRDGTFCRSPRTTPSSSRSSTRAASPRRRRGTTRSARCSPGS